MATPLNSDADQFLKNLSTPIQPFLVIDFDPLFVSQVQKTPLPIAPTAKIIGTPGDAIPVIRESQTVYSAVFLSIASTSPSALELLREVRTHRPATPVYLLFDTEAEPFSEVELTRLAIQQCVRKPVTLSELRGLLPVTQAAPPPRDPASPPKKAAQPEEPQAKLPEDLAYTSVRVEEFFSGVPSFFDAYIRLRPGKYLKILKAKESMDCDRAMDYLGAGVREFFFRKSNQMTCLAYCDFLALNILRNPHVSLDMKLLDVGRAGDHLQRRMKTEKELTEILVESGVEFVDQLFQMVRSQSSAPGELVKTYLNRSDLLEHATSVALTAVMLTRPLGIETTRNVTQVGLAATFHDVGLAKLDPKFLAEDDSLFSEDERRIYRQHPVKGAEVLGSFSAFDDVTLQAVAQHHERRNNTGFPSKVSTDKISLIAEIIGISDEFVRLLKQSHSDPGFNLPETLKRSVFPGFSPPVVDALKGVFLRSL